MTRPTVLSLAHRIIAALGLSVIPLTATAFDQRTHAVMSSWAWDSSNLASAGFRSHLGILDYPGSIGGLGDPYFDVTSPTAVRTSFRIESRFADRLLLSGQLPGLSLFEGWVIRGAIREDDNSLETPDSDEPGGIFTRVFGHFYDPYNNWGLKISGLTTQPKAVAWLLDPQAAVYDVVSTGPRYNHYSILSAREAMWRALTLTTSDGASHFVPVPTPSSMNALQIRNAYWATTFRALGDAIHVLQDMAQPQHTRNDPHSGLGCVAGFCKGGHASFFENYLKARTLKDPVFFLREAVFDNTDVGQAIFMTPDPLHYDGYPAVALPSYQQYFGLAANSSNNSLKGLANYSNRGFYSAGTNIGNDPYPDPPRDGTGLTVVSVSGLKTMTNQPVDGTIKFYVGDVQDKYTNTVDAGRLQTSYGAFNDFLTAKNIFSGYSLNHYNYDDQAELLVPRSVGYSAGMLNFFFRGSMTISPPEDGVYSIVDHAIENTLNPVQGFHKVRLKVKNTTASIADPSSSNSPPAQIAQDFSGGALVLVVKYHRNTCYTQQLDGEWGSDVMKNSLGAAVFLSQDEGGCRSKDEDILVSDIQAGVSLMSNEEKLVEFTFGDNVIPINATDVYLQVVYRGVVGQETDGIAVETKDINEPLFTGYANETDHVICAQGKWYYRGPNGEMPPEVLAIYPQAGSMFLTMTMANINVAYGPDEARESAPETNPLVQLSSLAPGSGLRFAVLADLSSTWGLYFENNPGGPVTRVDHSILPGDLTTRANQDYLSYDVPTRKFDEQPRARNVASMRGFYLAAGIHYYASDGTECNDPLPPDPQAVTQLVPVSLKGAWASPASP